MQVWVALEQETFSRLPGLRPKRLLAPSPIDLGEVQEIRRCTRVLNIAQLSRDMVQIGVSHRRAYAKLSTKGGYRTILGSANPEEASRDMGYRSDSLTISRPFARYGAAKINVQSWKIDSESLNQILTYLLQRDTTLRAWNHTIQSLPILDSESPTKD